MVFVVGFTVCQSHFQNLADNTSEENSLFLTVCWLVSQVREEFTIEQLVYTLFTVFLLLTGSEFLLQPFVCFNHRLNCILFIVIHFIEVCNDILERLSRTCDCLENLLVVFNSKCTHQENDRDCSSSCCADFDHEHSVTSLFNIQWFAHSVFLRENLSHFGSLSVSLVDFNCNAIRRKVFHRNENTFGSVDDEVASWVKWIFSTLSEEVIPHCSVFSGGSWIQLTLSSNVLCVQVTSSGADHNRHTTNLNSSLYRRGNTVAGDLEINGYRRHVC